MFGKGLLQGRFPRRELFLPLQVFQRVEARFFDAFQGGRQRAVNEVKVAAVAVADEGGVDEAGEVRFDVAFDGGLFEAVQLLFGVAVGGEDARQFGGEFAGRRDEFALAARQCRFPGGACARHAVLQADVCEQAGDDVVGEGAVAADFAVVQRHLGVAGQVFAQVFDFGL